MLRALGAFLAHLVVTAMTLAAVGLGLYLFAPKVLAWGLREHAQAALDHAAVGQGVQARAAETASSSRAQAACLKEASSAYRAGLATSQITKPAAPGTHGLIQGDDLATLWGQP